MDKQISVKWTDYEEDGYVLGTSSDFSWEDNVTDDKIKLALFDLDGTLILTGSGNKTPKDSNDWKLFNKKVKKMLRNFHEEGFKIVIVSNQLKYNDTWRDKLDAIQAKIKVPMRIYGIYGNNAYRKPSPLIWRKITKIALSKSGASGISKESFYCGDACGRKKDHSDCDYKFAINCGIKFMSPEQLFMKEDIDYDTIEPGFFTYSRLDQKDVRDAKKICQDITKDTVNKKYQQVLEEEYPTRCLIILVGVHGSGKTILANKLEELHGFKIVGPDYKKTSERKKVLKDLCEKKERIVVDSNNPSVKAREEILKVANEHKYKSYCVYLNVNKEIAKHNTMYRGFVSYRDRYTDKCIYK